jgi:carbamoyltransferase
MNSSIDSKPYVEHHPLFGHAYIANTNLDLPKPGGGQYRIRINSQGIRSDREYSPKKPKDCIRIVVCGDSMAAGQYLNNIDRFSELLERRLPGLEVINLALEGSGTDQQALIYEHVGLQYEHDAVLLLPFLQNVRRNLVMAREAIDPSTGGRTLRPKPKFELIDGSLVLRNVPVPNIADESLRDAINATDSQHSLATRLKTRVSALPGAALVKRMAYAAFPWEPFPEYRDARSPGWQLMSAIIGRLKDFAGSRPLIVAPTFYSSYVRFRMARNYWDRFSSLSTVGGIYAVDLLPYFRRMGENAQQCFQEPYDMHFSEYGNVVLADAFHEELVRLKVIPR